VSPCLMGSSSMAPAIHSSVTVIISASFFQKKNLRAPSQAGWNVDDVPPHNHMSSLSLFSPSRCFGRAATRFCRAPAWSGMMTSHSWSGALVEEDMVRKKVDVLGRQK
jgi:hypothetical protein